MLCGVLCIVIVAGGDCDCDTTPTWFSVTISINHLLLTTNRSPNMIHHTPTSTDHHFSSINFLIYCSVGEKFKAVVKKIYFKKGKTYCKSYWTFIWQRRYKISKSFKIKQAQCSAVSIVHCSAKERDLFVCISISMLGECPSLCSISHLDSNISKCHLIFSSNRIICL